MATTITLDSKLGDLCRESVDAGIAMLELDGQGTRPEVIIFCAVGQANVLLLRNAAKPALAAIDKRFRLNDSNGNVP